jgi:hypothetical protein
MVQLYAGRRWCACSGPPFCDLKLFTFTHCAANARTKARDPPHCYTSCPCFLFCFLRVLVSSLCALGASSHGVSTCHRIASLPLGVP